VNRAPDCTPASDPVSGLHGSESGNGPTLVILHGLFGSLDNFKSVAGELETHFKVLRLDLPAHGLSAATPTDLSFAAMAEAVSDAIVARGIKRFFLLGHSLGGKVAMTLAGLCASDQVPLQLLGLIVVDIAPRLYPPHHQNIIEALQNLPLAALKNRKEADLRLSVSIGEPEVRAFILKSLYRDPDLGHTWRFDLDAIARDYEKMRQIPPVESPIEAPTLFIKGAESDYLQRIDEPSIRAICIDAKFKIIGGAGHWPHAQKPAIFTKICLDFLKPIKDSLD